MRIILSKSQWQQIGKKAGWTKEAASSSFMCVLYRDENGKISPNSNIEAVEPFNAKIFFSYDKPELNVGFAGGYDIEDIVDFDNGKSVFKEVFPEPIDVSNPSDVSKWNEWKQLILDNQY